MPYLKSMINMNFTALFIIYVKINRYICEQTSQVVNQLAVYINFRIVSNANYAT